MSENDHSQCQTLLGSLSDYIDGELSEELCREIENHMSGCEHCRVVIDTLRKTVSLYHADAADCADIPSETRAHLFKVLHLEDYLSKE